MRIKPILLLLLLPIHLLSWAQRPFSIEVLHPKVDSIQLEINQIYNQIKLTHALFKEAKKLNLNYSNCMLYAEGDTTIGVLTNMEKKCILEIHYISSKENPIDQYSEIRQLNEEESELFNLKVSFQEEINKKKYEISNLDNCYLHAVLLPYERGYKYYVLTLSNQDSVIHFGNDYLFYFGYSAKLKSWKKLSNYTKVSAKREDSSPQSSGKIEMLWIGNQQSKQLPEAIDFVKFRLYHQNIKLDECFTIRNKREFTYNAVDNEISIKLFPNERK